MSGRRFHPGAGSTHKGRSRAAAARPSPDAKWSDSAEPNVSESDEDADSASTALLGGGDGSGTTSKPYVFSYVDQRAASILTGFQSLYDDGVLFDVTLTVDGGREFPCHRALLAAASDYFRCLFTTPLAEKDRTRIAISGVDAASMQLVVEFLYRGRVELTAETVQSLLSTANLFQLKDLRDGCAEFMEKKIDVENCIGIHFFAQAHECRDLELHAWSMIIENFDAVCETPEFVELGIDSLLEIIKYDDIQASEEDVFEAVQRWLLHRPEARAVHVGAVMQYVRFWLLDEHYLYDRVKPCALLRAEPAILAILDEVVHYKLLKDRWMETDLYIEPRYGADYCRVIIYTAYLDDEKKQVLQLFGQRSADIIRCQHSVICDLPSDLENPALLVTGDNDLYIAGGDSFGNSVSSVYKWCPEDNQFEDITGMHTPRKQFCLVQLDKCIYAVGGCNQDGNLSSVARFTEDTEEWETVAPLPKALRCFCATPYKGRLYVFGGESEKINRKMKVRGKRELNRSAFCYDPREDKWTTLAEMSTARALAGCTVFKSKIYVVGGFGTLSDSWLRDKKPENCLTSVEVYDPESNSWTSGPDLPLPLCSMGVVKYYGTVYVLGGENEEDVSNSVYYLNQEESRWDLKSEEMISGVTETTIYSSYAVINLDMDLD